MSGLPDMNDTVVLAKAGVADAPVQGTEAELYAGRGSINVDRTANEKASADPALHDEKMLHNEKQHALTDAHPAETHAYEDTPTSEELQTLRRVSGKIIWAAYTIAFCELCERFSYYGSSILYTNFVQQPLPPGQPAGANPDPDGVPGALGLGQQVSTAVSLVNTFFAYITPLLGAYIADAKLGRYKTIHIAIAISTLAHIILVIASIPQVLVNPNGSLAAFLVGMLTLCVGTGFFKANIAPLLAEQNSDNRIRVETLASGERVIVDPSLTNTRIFLWFYFAINCGALSGQISMVYVEKYVGFWLAFLLPTVLFIACPFVLYFNKKNYKLSPPTESVLAKFFHMFGYAMKGKWLKWGSFSWDVARPSNVPKEQRPKWMTYDDAWVDEVIVGLKACKVFLFLPLFWLAYNQMSNNIVSMAAVMQLGGAPNDIIQNLNPISIVIAVPLLDKLVYPGLRKVGINFTPIKRMTLGFFVAACAMISAAVTQHFIYQVSACGMEASSCDEKTAISVWVTAVPYILVGIAEIFTNVTSYEYAFSKAPANMKSLVMSVNLFMSAFSAALGQALVPLATDPLLVWNYTLTTILAVLGGIGFWICFRHYDKLEDKWNSRAKSGFAGKEIGGEALESDTENGSRV